jgi:hypothetical protein
VGISGGLVNALLFGARVESNSSASDYFKITSITAQHSTAVPEPSSLLLMGIGAALALRRSYRTA